MKKHDEKSADDEDVNLCTVTYSPVPEYISCPNCGLDIEFWSASDQTLCLFCGQVIFLCETTVH